MIANDPVEERDIIALLVMLDDPRVRDKVRAILVLDAPEKSRAEESIKRKDISKEVSTRPGNVPDPKEDK